MKVSDNRFKWQKNNKGKYNILKVPEDDYGFIEVIDMLIDSGRGVKLQRGDYDVTISISPSVKKGGKDEDN